MMITNLALNLRTSVLVLTAMMTLGGAYAYVTLPKESNPSIEIPNIVVTTIYPGASPKDVESLLTQVIEQEVQGINGIEEIRSTSTEGVSTVIIEFTPDVALSDANTKVREKVDLAIADLPGEAEEPIISEIDLSEFPIMTLNLTANYPLSRLKEVAEDLQDQLEALPSVLEVDLVGGMDREVQVDVNLAALQGYNLDFKDIIDTIRDENTNIPGGSIDVERKNYLVRVDGQFADPKEILSLVIKAPGGRPIRVRDVASVAFGFKDPTSHARLRVLREEGPDGLTPVKRGGYGRVISLLVKKRAGTNILTTADSVREVLAAAHLPPGTEVVITGDGSEQVEALVKDLENNIISGLVFVVAVLLFFLGVRTSLLVGVAIPLSMCLSFLVFMVMGQTLNFIILFSLIIALGMLVDNAVVIVENIYRFIEEGHDTFEAARLATAEVGGAVVASTATTVAAFVPMLFWPGMIGEFMSYMPLTLVVTLTSSLFVAVVMNPVLTGYFARVDGAHSGRSPWWFWVPILGLLGLAGAVLYGLNPTSFYVVLGSGVATVVTYWLVVRHMARWFSGVALPASIRFYRRALGWVLERDYTVRYAYVRNTLALGCLAVAPMLAALGGLLYPLREDLAWGLLYPAGAIGALGGLLVLLHTVETGVWVLLRLVTGRWYNLLLTDNRARLLNLSAGGLVGIVALFAMAPTGVEFFPSTDPNTIRVSVEAAVGTHVEASDALARRVQARVDEVLAAHAVMEGNVKNAVVNVGQVGGGLFGGGGGSPRKSAITLNLVDFKDRGEPSTESMNRLREGLGEIAGAEIEFERDEQGPPTGPPVNIELAGPKFGEIVRLSTELKTLLAEAARTQKIKGLVDIRDDLDLGRPEYAVHIDRSRAAQFGLNTQRIASTVRTAINGSKASTWRTGKDEYDITVRLAEADRVDLESLENLTIMNEGQQVPLVAVADFKVGSGLGSITHKDLNQTVTIMANVADGHNKAEVLAQVQALLGNFQATLPTGYTMAYTGEDKEQAESFAFLTRALMVGAALISMILIAQFNSVVIPFLIMFAVLLSLVGVLLGLTITRTPFSLFTFIGIISLAGIVVNNNIVLIDYTELLRKRGMGKREAIIECGATRMRPVLLTAMTTVLGLIPLTFGINIDFVGFITDFAPDLRLGSENTQFWGPMGITIISGLTFATFLTLVTVPVMYSVLDSIVSRMKASWVEAKRGREPDSPPMSSLEG